jgi:hypothetical protein
MIGFIPARLLEVGYRLSQFEVEFSRVDYGSRAGDRVWPVSLISKGWLNPWSLSRRRRLGRFAISRRPPKVDGPIRVRFACAFQAHDFGGVRGGERSVAEAEGMRKGCSPGGHSCCRVRGCFVRIIRPPSVGRRSCRNRLAVDSSCR